MGITELKKWENELNTCIRCGYCYEHCHLFKVFNWESDTPRGKLLLAYGLLTGELQPSTYIAEKIFECFYCKNCEKSCSAKVPVTDIFTTARESLVAAGFDVDGISAKVNEDLCSGCGICTSRCKAEALSFKERDDKKQASVNKVKCQGCGICISACPSDAITQRNGFGVSPEELLSKVMDFLEDGKQLDNAPRIIVFCCNWSVYPELQFSTLVGNEEAISPIVVTMCSGRIAPELILQTFARGAWGVLVAACPIGECEHDGNYIALGRTFLLKNVLQQFNIDPERVKLEWVARGESAKLRNAMNEFHGKLAELGPIRS
jgi:coenzyme F420-reducing hydrogenase delta subunit/NAD-dependent dihydropyrimidine dehydrogenase PreA subunit